MAQGRLIADVQRPGKHRLQLRASDGVRLWVDGKLRLNRWSQARSPRLSTTAPIFLSRGRHRLRIEYYEQVGPASVQLRWSGPGFSMRVVPAARLFKTAKAPTPPPGAWSDPKTWGGTVPVPGSAVTIPAGKLVVLDQDVSVANLTVNGTLRFARRNLTHTSMVLRWHG